MGKKPKTGWIEARGLFRRGAREYLIFNADAANEASLWEFPGGRLLPRESPEAGLRRCCRTLLGVEVDFELGQPPFVHDFGTHTVTFRYYAASIRDGAIKPPRGADCRWVLEGQLRDYEFDAATQRVVDWLLEENEEG
jgi:8-oxo-dGTP diphosphatase